MSDSANPEGFTRHPLTADADMRHVTAAEVGDSERALCARQRAAAVREAAVAAAERVALLSSPAYAFLRKFSGAGSRIVSEGSASGPRPHERVAHAVAATRHAAAAGIAVSAIQAVAGGSFGQLTEEERRRLLAFSMFKDGESVAEVGRLHAREQRARLLGGACRLAGGSAATAVSLISAAQSVACVTAASVRSVGPGINSFAAAAALAWNVLPGVFARAASDDLRRCMNLSRNLSDSVFARTRVAATTILGICAAAQNKALRLAASATDAATPYFRAACLVGLGALAATGATRLHDDHSVADMMELLEQVADRTLVATEGGLHEAQDAAAEYWAVVAEVVAHERDLLASYATPMAPAGDLNPPLPLRKPDMQGIIERAADALIHDLAVTAPEAKEAWAGFMTP